MQTPQRTYQWPRCLRRDSAGRRQVGEGAPRLRTMYLATVAWLISTPSLSSSLWIRGAPRAGWRCSSAESGHESRAPLTVARISSANAKTRGIPDGCHWITVAGLTNTITSRHTHNRARPRASGRSRTAGVDPAAGDEEPAADGAGRGSLDQEPPGYEIGGQEQKRRNARA